MASNASDIIDVLLDDFWLNSLILILTLIEFLDSKVPAESYARLQYGNRYRKCRSFRLLDLQQVEIFHPQVCKVRQ